MLLELNDIVKRYPAPPGKEPLTVLDGVSVQVGQGETVAVVGPSGSGKSTLLNIIGALDSPTSGAVLFDGRDMAGMSENSLARIRNTEIGFVFQLHHLLPQCTAIENVLIPTIVNKDSGGYDDIRHRAEELLGLVGLGNRRDYYSASLSGGERQRVAVVRALINGPKMLLADEPTGSLDHASAESLGRLLLDINASGKTALIVVTHSIALAERMDTVYRLCDGRLERD